MRGLGQGTPMAYGRSSWAGNGPSESGIPVGPRAGDSTSRIFFHGLCLSEIRAWVFYRARQRRASSLIGRASKNNHAGCAQTPARAPGERGLVGPLTAPGESRFSQADACVRLRHHSTSTTGRLPSTTPFRWPQPFSRGCLFHSLDRSYPMTAYRDFPQMARPLTGDPHLKRAIVVEAWMVVFETALWKWAVPGIQRPLSESANIAGNVVG